jgi:hypothetical protein
MSETEATGATVDLARLREIVAELAELEPRLGGSSSEVDLSLLERVAELADEASRLLERLAAATG